MKLFEPAKIGKLEIPNRIVMAPMATNYATSRGEVSQRLIAYYEERAKGGTGLIIVEGTCVSPPEGKGWACEICLHRDSLVSGHAVMVEILHSYGAKVFVQLHHAGRQTNLGVTEGISPVAPSAVPLRGGPVPRELTTEEVKTLVKKFVAAAERAKRAGYDGIELHGAHGYLIHQFLSPMTNQRKDEYGGSVEKRLRFSIEIILGIKERLGMDFPVGLRMSAEGGYSLEEAKNFVKPWEEAGLDVIHVSAGGIGPVTYAPREESPLAHKEGWIVPFAQAIKGLVEIPVIAVSEIRHPQFAASVLEAGQADFIALGRPLLADPAWASKARGGHPEDIRRCISCGWCVTNISPGTPVHCVVNPELGRELEMAKITPAVQRKQVMVVGSGPAGMEAARVAALRGHQVNLYEKERELGAGQLRLAAAAPGKEKLRWVKQDLETQLRKLPVKLHLGTEVDKDLVEKLAPEVLIVATGARPAQPTIPGLNKAVGAQYTVPLLTAHEVLAGQAQLQGKKVVVLGGWQTGCETAEYLASRGFSVSIVARSSQAQMAADAIPLNRAAMFARLDLLKVEIIPEHDVKEIEAGGLRLISQEGKERFLVADTIVLARGVVPNREWAEGLEAKVAEVYYIGDCAQPATIAEATYQAAVIARRI